MMGGFMRQLTGISIKSYPSGNDFPAVNVASTTAGCIAIAWIATSGQPNNCFRKNFRMPFPDPLTSDKISGWPPGTEVDTVELFSAPLCFSMSCPQNDGAWCSSYGLNYLISCYSSYSTSFVTESEVATLGQCADICATTPDALCQGANFIADTTSNNCQTFSAPFNPDPPNAMNPIPGAASIINMGLLWQGFGPHPLALSLTPTVKFVGMPIICSDYTDDDVQYTVANGMVYKISCHTNYLGGDIGNTMAPDFPNCLALCSTMPGCIGVSWVPSRGFANCNLKTSSALLPGITPDSLGAYTEVDVAVMVEAPLCSSMNCPSANGAFCSSDGTNREIFKFSCDTIDETSYYSEKYAPSFQACADICAATSSCQAFDWYAPIFPDENDCLIVETLDNPVPSSGGTYGGRYKCYQLGRSSGRIWPCQSKT